MELQELEQVLEDLGRPRFHARQIFQWVHKTRRHGLRADDRPRPGAARADDRTPSESATRAVSRRERSEDGTTKLLLRLEDGKQIESVFIPDTPGDDLLHLDSGRLRDEVRFCLTGKMGMVRNLTAGRSSARSACWRASWACSTPASTSSDGHGEPLPQLRRR